jgi:hypothetical protein
MKRKHVSLILLCFFVVAFCSYVAFASELFVNPTGGKKINHSPFHTGIDVFSKPSEKVYSMIVGKVLRIESDEKSSWCGLTIKGNNDDVNYAVRILGINPITDVETKVDLQTAIGIAQDPSIDFPGIKPYLHIELYQDGKRIDPTNFIVSRLKDRPMVHPAVGIDCNRKINQLVDSAKGLEREKNMQKQLMFIWKH